MSLLLGNFPSHACLIHNWKFGQQTDIIKEYLGIQIINFQHMLYSSGE